MWRIAQIIGQLSWGGAERQLYELSVRLPAEGFEPWVYCLSENTAPYREMLELKGIRVRIIPRRSHFDVGRVYRLRKALDQDGVVLAHAWLIDDDSYTAAAHLFRRRPWIASMRSRLLDRGRFRWPIDSWAVRQADRVVANQREVVAFLAREMGCAGGHVRLIHNGIDLERLRPQRAREEIRAELHTPVDALVLLFIGRLDQEKQVDRLLLAFQIILKCLPQVSLWILGEGRLAPALQAQSQTLGLEEQVFFLGVREDVPDFYHAADLLVLCSSSEGLPNVVLESMGCGTPALVTPGCGCQELIQKGENGWITPDDQPETLAQWISQVLTDPEGLRRAGERAVTKIREEYSVSRMVTQMAGLYRELLDERRVG